LTVLIDHKAFGLGITSHVRLRAIPGEVKRLAQILVETPEVVEADRVTGEDCFLAMIVVGDMSKLETVIDRFSQFSSTDTAIIQSSTSPVGFLICNAWLCESVPTDLWTVWTIAN
jgi:Lrp/AsnC family transcriptional regulator, leucine-responsive regulatory protein